MRQYIALIHKDADSDYGVSFPDLPGVISAGGTLDEARAMATEALAFHLEGLAEDGEAVPEPSSLEAIMSAKENRDGVAVLIAAPDVEVKSVRINITMPADVLARGFLDGSKGRLEGQRCVAMKTLKVGIASAEDMIARTMSIARGELKATAGDPKVWFTSPESFAKVLSNKNRELLNLIATTHPESLQDLAAKTGRKPSNLSRTLKTMEHYGFVKLHRGERGKIRPEVPYQAISLTLAL